MKLRALALLGLLLCMAGSAHCARALFTSIDALARSASFIAVVEVESRIDYSLRDERGIPVLIVEAKVLNQVKGEPKNNIVILLRPQISDEPDLKAGAQYLIFAAEITGLTTRAYQIRASPIIAGEVVDLGVAGEPDKQPVSQLLRRLASARQ